MIDTTAPETNGHVTLTSAHNELIASWRDIFDPEDPDATVYIAIGKSVSVGEF